ncbi:DUF3788 family protein [bacterium]|nr:DUF3788 family protein [bacterium]
MKKELLSRCGYRCDLCLAYAERVRQHDQRNELSDGWHRIFGFRISPEKIVCNGCLQTDDSGTTVLIDKTCPVRPCTAGKGLENCAQCGDYCCEKLKERIVVYGDLEGRITPKISRTEYLRFIKPYENKKRLDAFRQIHTPYFRMLNPAIIPDDAGMRLFLGRDEVLTVWDGLLEFMDCHYRLERTICFGGKKYGWAVKYRHRTKTIVTFFPERHSLTVLMVFGRKELESVSGMSESLHPDILHMIGQTKLYHDGKWVWIRLKDDRYEKHIRSLIGIKRKPL